MALRNDGIIKTGLNISTAGVGGVPFEGQGFGGHYGPVALGSPSSGSSSYSGGNNSRGCQASRTPQLPTFDFTRGILKMAALFGGIPAMPSILQKMK